MDRTQAIAFHRRDQSGKTRERKAVNAFARKAGFEIVAELSDESDTDILMSSGFARVLRRIARSGVQTVIVASAASFAADTLVQTVGWAKLSQFGITLIAADGSGFTSDLIATKLVERILAQGSGFDNLLRVAHAQGTNARLWLKVGPNWRKQYVDTVPEAVRLAKNLYDKARRAGTRITLRDISAQLAEGGHLNNSGKPFHPQEIDRMIRGPNRRSSRRMGG
jgi:hypothetical protein